MDRTRKEHQEWHSVNARILEAAFSSDQIVNDYKQRVQQALKGGKFENSTKRSGEKFLRDLIEMLPLHPEGPSSTISAIEIMSHRI